MQRKFSFMDKKLLISKPIEGELEQFVSYYKDSISSDNVHIQEAIEYILNSEGKKIRPILLLLSAKLCGEINLITFNCAITIELLHTATLIHNNVVDESLVRRGNPSLNAKFDNKVAVLVGDYFLSTALIKSVLTGNINLISHISDLGRNLSEGELNQLYIAREISFNENDYYEVIQKKTASLLSVSMKMGALSVGGSDEVAERFEKIGNYLGICFQLRDDIFDYFGEDVGKPTGNDIREGKVTLPLIFALNNAPEKVQIHYKNVLKKQELEKSEIDELIAFARNSGGIEYAYQSMKNFSDKAHDLIMEFPDSEIRVALLNTIDYVVERKY